MIRKYCVAILLLLLLRSIFSINQNNIVIRNINPDPFGEPWLAGGYPDSQEINQMSQNEIDTILSRINSRDIRENIDHSFSFFMRPVFNQDGGSCGSASRISYMFAYEINNYRNVSGNLPENIYPSHFTWLLTNQNSSKDQIAMANGIPNSVDYGGDTYSTIYGGNIYWPTIDESDYGWMNGYSLWYNAMQNRLQNNLHITLDNPDNLLVLKSWMDDHHGDQDFNEGGVAGAGCAITGATYAQIPSGEYEEGKYIVREWGPTVDHGTTWSGYDDNIGFDVNEDGQITNNLDINGDNVIDMADWERGALIMLNSWGSDWRNSGTVYVPYRLLLINNMSAEFYYIKKDIAPKQVLKVNMVYDKRRRIKLSVGVSSDPNATEPDAIVTCHHFNYAGLKDVAMLGVWADNTEHFENMDLGYDLSDLFFGIDTTQPYRYFIGIETTGNTGGYGIVNSVSVMDYVQDPLGLEYPSAYEDVVITDGDAIYIPIDMPGDPNSDPYITVPQSEMSVYYYDSAQAGIDSLPENSIDDNPETIWHTVWGSGYPCPHEIQYDLGSSYEIGALAYLPRQIGSNGRIMDYEVYIGQTPDDFGLPVDAGTWADTSNEQIVFFTPKEGRYVRLVALSEVNGGPWTSVAEIKVFQPPVLTSIDDEYSLGSSQSMFLSNFPNPFNPSTTINFTIQTNSSIDLTIFNIKGQKIKTLANSGFPKGYHSIVWDGDDESGKSVSSGVYYYKFNVNGKTEVVKKCLLLK